MSVLGFPPAPRYRLSVIVLSFLSAGTRMRAASACDEPFYYTLGTRSVDDGVVPLVCEDLIRVVSGVHSWLPLLLLPRHEEDVHEGGFPRRSSSCFNLSSSCSGIPPSSKRRHPVVVLLPVSSSPHMTMDKGSFSSLAGMSNQTKFHPSVKKKTPSCRK